MRSAKPEDAPTLLKLARMVHFINLPADKDIIADKIRWSQTCFQRLAERQRPDGTLAPDEAGAAPVGSGKRSRGSAADGRENGHARTPHPSAATAGHGEAEAGGAGHSTLNDRSKVFMFVLEEMPGEPAAAAGAGVGGDVRSGDSGGGAGGVLGTSQIITSMGGVGHPNLSFELIRKEMFSTSLQSGATHIVAKLKLDESGPTEIGGLILQPSYRGHKARLGRFLSIVRFHFMGLYRPVVADRVLAEMMGPVTPDGQNTLWEYLGRRFINLTYTEADRFCQHSREFMLSLLPREEIYLTLLPPEARRIIAQVGPETEPAKRMLEKLGFQYRNCVDPFDGGPNLEAATDDITVVKDTRRARLGPAIDEDAATRSIPAMVSVLDSEGEFRAVQSLCQVDDGGRGRDEDPVIRIHPAHMRMLGAEAGEVVGFTSLGSLDRPAGVRSAPSAQSRARTSAKASAKSSAKPGAAKPAKSKRSAGKRKA